MHYYVCICACTIVADELEDVSCDLQQSKKKMLTKCIYYFLFLGYLSYNGRDLSDTSHTTELK